MGESPDWLISLAQSIQDIEGCDAALAASRARALSSNEALAEGIQLFAVGSLKIQESLDTKGITPWQSRTFLRLLSGITSRFSDQLKNGTK